MEKPSGTPKTPKKPFGQKLFKFFMYRGWFLILVVGLVGCVLVASGDGSAARQYIALHNARLGP